MSKLLIRNGRILDPGRDVDLTGDVLIADGKIAAIGQDLAANGAEVIDATGLIVCPGFVDIHTHLRDPGQEYKESIETGTRAAARGGFTPVCCMPNTDPPIDTPATVEYGLRTAPAPDARVLPLRPVSQGPALRALAAPSDSGQHSNAPPLTTMHHHALRSRRRHSATRSGETSPFATGAPDRPAIHTHTDPRS